MITLKPETERDLLASIQRYFQEHMEEEIGDLKASMLLRFVLEEIGPSVYNQAVSDARAHMLTQADDLSGVCYEEEFGSWKKGK